MAEDSALPLQGPAPGEIALEDAPLVRVIAQARFPLLLAARNPDKVADFQDAIRDQYPHLEQQELTTFRFGPGSASPEGIVHWRFSDETRGWRVTLSPEFIALETTNYESRSDFLGRLRVVVQALEDTLAPNLIIRFGIRYIDQIKGEPLYYITKLVRHEVLGVASSLGTTAKHFFTEIVVPADPDELLARWGKLSAGLTIDPNVIAAIGEDSWIIDLDVSHSGQGPFETASIMETADRAAERVYAVFRWMVTDEFLRVYGGNV